MKCLDSTARTMDLPPWRSRAGVGGNFAAGDAVEPVGAAFQVVLKAVLKVVFRVAGGAEERLRVQADSLKAHTRGRPCAQHRKPKHQKRSLP